MIFLTSGFMIPGGACRISSTAMTIYWNASEIYWFHQFDSEYPNLRQKNTVSKKHPVTVVQLLENSESNSKVQG